MKYYSKCISINFGTEIPEEARSDKEIEKRGNIAKEKISKMASLLTSRKLKLKTKIRIVKCYIYSLFCYGCESWTLSKVLEAKIESFEMLCLRKIGNVKWSDRVSNDRVLEKLKTKRTLLSDIKKRKLRYFGHVKRSNNILTTVVEGKLEGRRPRGRPRNTWMTDVREWTGLPASACTSRAADRSLWSVIARQPLQRR